MLSGRRWGPRRCRRRAGNIPVTPACSGPTEPWRSGVIGLLDQERVLSMPTGAKLIVAALLIVGMIVYLAYQGAADTWQYYVTVDECLSDGDALAGNRIRVSGPIEAGSLSIAPDRAQVSFALAGTRGGLRVSYHGVLPDNLRETIDVVAEGRMETPGELRADKLLTRCAGKYAAKADQQTASQSPSSHPSELR